MKRIITCLTFVVICLTINAQGSAVAYGYDSDSYTNVRNAPNGKVVDKISNEYSTIFCIDSPTNGWWRIVGNCYERVESGEEFVVLKGSTTGYWIHYSVIACSTRNYDNQTIELKAMPNDKAKVVGKLNTESTVHPIDVSGEWVKVKTEDGKLAGWLEADWLCSNPVTTCP
ncbi:MAG: SH3 domain-containing protein [Prevotella sp.]|nr:SH3 domain-containing protein [Prevotella sp.]